MQEFTRTLHENCVFAANATAHQKRDQYERIMFAINSFSDSIDECMLDTTDDSIVRRYIKICLYQIRKLLDSLPEEWLSSLETTDYIDLKATTDPHIAVCLRLEELIDHISEAYGSYFNLNEWAPDIYREMARQRMLPEVIMISSWLENAGSELSELHSIIMDAFSSLDREYHEYPITFAKVAYLKTLHTVLWSFCEQEGNEVSEQSLFDLLLLSNMNGPDNYFYAIDRFKEQLEGLKSAEKLNMLRHFKMDLVESYCESEVAYNNSVPSLQQMLIEWLDAETELYLPY